MTSKRSRQRKQKQLGRRPDVRQEQNLGEAAPLARSAGHPSLVLIPQANINEVWPLAHDFITAACKWGEYSAEDLAHMCAEDRGQLWFVWSDHLEAAVVTSLIGTPTGNVCTLLACGGKNMDRWLGLLDDIEAWAKSKDCIATRLYGRPGWKRKLPDYEMTRIIMDKRLI